MAIEAMEEYASQTPPTPYPKEGREPDKTFNSLYDILTELQLKEISKVESINKINLLFSSPLPVEPEKEDKTTEEEIYSGRDIKTGDWFLRDGYIHQAGEYTKSSVNDRKIKNPQYFYSLSPQVKQEDVKDGFEVWLNEKIEWTKKFTDLDINGLMALQQVLNAYRKFQPVTEVKSDERFPVGKGTVLIAKKLFQMSTGE